MGQSKIKSYQPHLATTADIGHATNRKLLKSDISGDIHALFPSIDVAPHDLGLWLGQ
jgi:hypothetical protein